MMIDMNSSPPRVFSPGLECLNETRLVVTAGRFVKERDARLSNAHLSSRRVFVLVDVLVSLLLKTTEKRWSEPDSGCSADCFTRTHVSFHKFLINCKGHAIIARTFRPSNQFPFASSQHQPVGGGQLTVSVGWSVNNLPEQTRTKAAARKRLPNIIRSKIEHERLHARR